MYLQNILQNIKDQLSVIKSRVRQVRALARANRKEVPEGVDPEKWKEFLKEWDTFQKEYSNFQLF